MMRRKSPRNLRKDQKMKEGDQLYYIKEESANVHWGQNFICGWEVRVSLNAQIEFMAEKEVIRSLIGEFNIQEDVWMYIQ